MKIELDDLKKAISDPGAFVLRDDNFQEPITSWSARAVALVIAEHDTGASHEPLRVTRQRSSMNFRDTSRVNQERADKWHKDGSPWTASDWAVALTGELGELCNLIKKLNRVNDGIASTNNFLKDGKPMDLMSEIKTEIGDVFLYLDLLSTHLGIDLETAVIDTFNRVSDREGFKEKLPY